MWALQFSEHLSMYSLYSVQIIIVEYNTHVLNKYVIHKILITSQISNL